MVNIRSDLMKHRYSIKGRLAFNRQRNAFSPCISTFPSPLSVLFHYFLSIFCCCFVCLVFETGALFLFRCLFCDSSRAERRFARKFATIVSIENEFSQVRLKYALYLELQNFRVQWLSFVGVIYFICNINCNRLFSKMKFIIIFALLRRAYEKIRSKLLNSLNILTFQRFTPMFN